MDLILPYKIGDFGESKTFEEGFRGAWFRCKINGMRVKEGHLECYLEYIDYEIDNKEWIRLFQNNTAYSNEQSSDHIMVRPAFPQWHWKDKVPEQLPNNEVIAIVDENWKVGDMVDWFSQDCFWSGKITRLLNKDMVKVKLFEPPLGEGQSYDVNVNDLRPTLDWSLTRGWTVPLSQARGKSWHVVRLIHHKSAESETSSDDGDKGDTGGDGADSQDVQHVIAPNTRAPGSRILRSSARNSMSNLKTQQDKLRSMADLKAPSDGVEPAVTSSRPCIGIELEQGMGNSIEQDQADIQDQYLQNLAKGDGNRKELLERTRLMECKAALLSFLLAMEESLKTM